MADLELNSIGNGDGNNYLLRDNSKIPLSGSNQISGDLIPSTDGTVNLGSSSKKFASLNGIAPDELGLPTGTYTDVSSYITNFTLAGNTFTAPVSGLFYFAGSVSNNTNLECALVNNTKNYGVNYTNILFNNVRGILPVEKGDSINVTIPTSASVTARIYHLKGKV